MQRFRKVSGPPRRTASATWSTIEDLIVKTLASSPSIDESSVRTELSPLAGIGAAVLAGGHIATKAIVLISGDLDLSITVAYDDEAMKHDENLNPVPGGTSAGAAWKLHLPDVGPLNAAVAGAVSGSVHLTTSEQEGSRDLSKTAPQKSVSGLVDLAALDALPERS